MGKRFIDLHVHSSKSGGADSRADLESFASRLGVKINFCDGAASEDGIELTFKSKAELKNRSLRSPYLILNPLSKEALNAAVRIKRAVINARLTPSIARSMHDNRCAVEFKLSTLVHARGVARINSIKDMRSNLKVARKYDVQMLATTGSRSIYDLRPPYQVFWLLKVIGFTDPEAADAMYNGPQGALDHGRAVMEGRIVDEGVMVV